jgi:DNA repair protein SbcD/Mre11
VTVQIAHLSDTHIGYEAYAARSASGENQRSVDIAKAFATCVSEIVADDPALVIHSGDVADRTIIPIRMMLFIRQQISRLASLRPDGTRRQVIIVAGNHELPRNRKEACFLHLLDGLPGVHVVTADYQRVEFDTFGAGQAHESLTDVVVHVLPHDTLKTVEFDTVTPLKAKTNILTAHGVAGGSELYVRSLGREFAIPTDVLARNWEYVALGHWHKQGPVPLFGAKKDGDHGRIWYAGSPENMGFGDLRDNGTRRGWLKVTVRPGQDPVVERRHIPIRAMLRLPVVDAAGLDPEQLTELLVERVNGADVTGAVCAQIVENVTRETWSLVNLVKVRSAAGQALHYEVSTRHRRAADTERQQPGAQPGGSGEAIGLGAIEAVLDERASALLSDFERDGAVAMAKELVRVEMARAFRSDTATTAAAAEQPDGGATAPVEALTTSTQEEAG